MDATTTTRFPWRTFLLLIGISLLIRLLIGLPISYSGMSPLYDENTYLTRAVGYGNVVRAYFTGNTPTQTDWDWGYRNGGWPPLHPLLIGIAFAVFGPGLVLARLIVMLQSAATTGVVFALTHRLAGRRAAIFAAGLHIVYPSFVGYSHLLWSETTYILVLLVAVQFALKTAKAERTGGRIFAAVACGTFLGLTGLTRAAVLPLLCIIPIWVGWRMKTWKQRFAVPAVVWVTALVWLSPWLWNLHVREGRFVLLSTAAGYNLYLGNNPWSLEAQSRSEARTALQDYMREHQVSRDEAGRALALHHIRADYPGFLKRCWSHARAMFVPDWYVLRHLFYAIYPPVSSKAAYGLLIAFALSFAVFGAATLAGLLFGSRAAWLRGLPLLCVVFGFLPHVLTIANSRMTFPLLALLLPAAGAGLALLNRRRAWLGFGVMCIGMLAGQRLVNPGFPEGALGTRNQISTYYSEMEPTLAQLFGADDLAGKDRVLLRCQGSAARAGVEFIITVSPDSFVLNSDGRREVRWSPSGPDDTLTLEIITPHVQAAVVPTITILNLGTHEARDLQPVRSDAWRRWQPTSLGEVEFMWLGSAGIPDEQMSLLLQTSQRANRLLRDSGE